MLRLDPLKEAGPEGLVQRRLPRLLRAASHRSRDLGMPIVRLRTQLEQWRRLGASDLDNGNLHAEETNVLPAEAVKEVERLPMLLAERGCHPHYGTGVRSSSIGEDLPEVTVVSRGELVFDNQYTVVGEVSSDQVEGEAPYGVLSGTELELYARERRRGRRSCPATRG